MRRLTHILFLLAGTLGTSPALGAEVPAEEQSELKAKLDQARQEVDRAVAKLADLFEEKAEQASQVEIVKLFSFSSGAELGVFPSHRDDQGGVLLEGVLAGSGADQAGLKAGDRLVTIDDVRLDETGGREALLDHMQTVKPDQEVVLQVLREGETEQVSVVAQARSSQIGTALDEIDLDLDWNFDGFEAMGHRVEMAAVSRLVDLDADLGAYFGVDQGVLVLNAPEDGELKSGDVLLSVGGEAVSSTRQAHLTIAGAEEPVTAEVMRKKSQISVSIAPDAFPQQLGKRIRVIKLKEDESS